MIKIRRATAHDIPAISRVHIASWKTTYRGILPAAFLDALSQEKHEARHRRIMGEPGKHYLVAEDSSREIIGFASAGPERSGEQFFHGELYAIYLLESHQRRRVGAELLHRVADQLRADGLEAMLVWVLDRNPAKEFYRRLGGELLRKQLIEIGGVSLEEVGFGWRDLTALSAASSQ